MLRVVETVDEVTTLRGTSVEIGLSEYLSRHARNKVATAILHGIRERLKREDGTQRVGAVAAFASLAGVTDRTVQRWISNGIQSCNLNAEKILSLAAEYCPEEAEKILVEDLERHQSEFKVYLKLAKGLGRHGGVASHDMGVSYKVEEAKA